MTATRVVGAASHDILDWHAIDWRQVNQTVRRLQTRIVKAIQDEVAILFRTHGDKSTPACSEVCSMGQPMRQNYPAEFQERAVKLAVESDQPMAQTARDRGVHEHTLHTWIGQDHRVERQTPQVNDEHLYEEWQRLRKEKARLKEERDILKKAAAYFAPPRP